jgi:esterase/lipase superfamily enzyme
MNRSRFLLLLILCNFFPVVHVRAQDNHCPTAAPYLDDLRRAAFLTTKGCPDEKLLKEVLWRFRLTIGSPAGGSLTEFEQQILKDKRLRASQREPLKADLVDDEIKRQLIASAALDSDVEHATLAVLRQAIITFRNAIGSQSVGPLTDAERQELKRGKETLESFAGFQTLVYPGSAMDIIVPVNLVGSQGQGDKSWMKYERADESMSVHYFWNPLRAYTANAMATTLLERRRGLYFEYLSLAGDEFAIEGSALKRDPKSDRELPIRELIMASGREQNGQLFGVHVKAYTDPAPDLKVPLLKVAALPLDQIPSPNKLPETAEQTNWRLVVKSINNMIVSDFNKLNGRAAIPIHGCRGVEQQPLLQRKIVNIVYATDRKYQGAGATSDNDSLKNLFSPDPWPTMHVGCVRVSVPNTLDAKTQQELPEARAMRFAGAGGSRAAKARPYEFSIPAGDPKEIDLSTKNRYYFPADERTAFLSYDRALLFIHGYNNDFEEAIKRTAQIAAASDYDGFIYTFSWPSQGRFSRYVADMDSAEQAEIDLIHFMRMILGAGVETRLDVIAHSMGSQILLRTLDAIRPMFDRRLGGDYEGKVRFGQVIFAAPDVAEPVFRRKVLQLRQFADRVTVYASANDGALDFSGWLRGVSRAGSVGANGRPMTVENIHVIDITGKLIPRYLMTRYFSSTHSAFAFDKQVLQDIHTILEEGAYSDKAAKRTPNMRASVSGQPNKFIPGDCAELAAGHVTWWKMQVEQVQLSAKTVSAFPPGCPADAADFSPGKH